MANELKLGDGERNAAEEVELAAYQREFLDLLSSGNGEPVDPDFSGLRGTEGEVDKLDGIFGEGVDHAIVKDYRRGLPEGNILGLTSGEPYWEEGEGSAVSADVRESICGVGVSIPVNRWQTPNSTEFFLDDDDLLEAGGHGVGQCALPDMSGKIESVMKRKPRIREDI